jgi:hypothetical protein
MHAEVLTPRMATLAPRLCEALAGVPFVLAGGTALALQIGHRISVDFDWFCPAGQLPRDLAERVGLLDPAFQVIQDRQDTFECLIGGVKCSFFEFAPRFAEAAETIYGLPLAPLLDIAAMKLIAISQRGSRKDFYDLHAVLQRIAFRQITSRLTEMYDPRRLNPMHLAKLLVYFDDAEGEPEPQLLHRTDWASVRQWFEERIREYTQILLEETAKP